METTITPKDKVIFALVVVIILLVVGMAGYLAWQNHVNTVDKLQQAIILTQEQAQEVNVLQNKLMMSKQNADLLANYIAKAQTGQIQPVTHFTVQAPSLAVATEQVREKINNKEPVLPPVVLEKTDHTIVVPNTNKNPKLNYDIGVFKVNNYRNWEWSVGYGQHGGDRYMPVELQRNFSKDAALSYEYHVKGKEKGWEVKYIRKTDKLFFLF